MQANDGRNEFDNRKVRDPNNFLSSQFRIHSGVFQLPVKENYTELSSGVNQFAAPAIWKETIIKEIDEGFLYQSYTSLDGHHAVRNAVKLYERFLYSGGDIFLKADLEVCMTIGASQAADLALSYLSALGKKKLLLAGMMYPLYVTLGISYGFEIHETDSSLEDRGLPTADELIKEIEEQEYEAVVICYPGNPSGERYTDNELDRIMQVLHERKVYCIFDCACNIIMSEKKVIVPETHIIKNKMGNHCIIVNSFSKTEGVPGFRLGYIAGNFDLMQFVKPKQVAIMNPPNIPAIAIWLTMLFRCLYLSEQYGQDEKDRQKIIRCFKKTFFYSTPQCLPNIRAYVRQLMDERLQEKYMRYKEDRLNQERIFFANKAYIEENLKPFIKTQTDMDSGFNYMIKLKPCCNVNELDFCKSLLQKSGIAVFTESGFTIKNVKQNDYWIRISLAVEEKQFRCAVDRMKQYLTEME